MNKFFALFFVLLILSMPFGAALAEEAETESFSSLAVEKSDTLPYNYSDTHFIPIRLAVTKELSTEFPIPEGQTIELRVVRDVHINDKILLKKGDIVTGKVETIITSGMNGFPAEIILDDFNIPNVKSSQLISVYTKKGQNRCFWVYPLKWSLTFIPFVGSLTNLIMGGHARINTTDIITIYYYPNWK